ncbi:MAG: GspH/FimT family pseudopilin [Thiohalomonadaceae bacterium]
MKKAAGFTLVELMITLAVAAILLRVAVPAFINMAKSNRLTAQVNMFVTSMNFARNEAINRRQNFTVEAIDDDWTQGWEVTDAGGNVVRVVPALHPATTFTANNDTFTFTYQPNGRITGPSDTLAMCDDRNGEQGRQITVSPTGRISVEAVPCP